MSYLDKTPFIFSPDKDDLSSWKDVVPGSISQSDNGVIKHIHPAETSLNKFPSPKQIKSLWEIKSKVAKLLFILSLALFSAVFTY